jgi:hypothetical protein
MELSVEMRIITVTKVDRYFPHVVKEKLIDKMIHLFALNFISSLKQEKRSGKFIDNPS